MSNPLNPVFECMAFDADCPSMTVRFQVPEGFPLAGGIYRIERIRSATDADNARFAKYRDPPDGYELEDALRAVRERHVCSCRACREADAMLAARSKDAA